MLCLFAGLLSLSLFVVFAIQSLRYLSLDVVSVNARW